jgi:hypothetical protein
MYRGDSRHEEDSLLYCMYNYIHIYTVHIYIYTIRQSEGFRIKKPTEEMCQIRMKEICKEREKVQSA